MIRGILLFMMIGSLSPHIMSMEQGSKELEERTELEETLDNGDAIIFLAKKRNIPESVYPTDSSSPSFKEAMQKLLQENKKILKRSNKVKKKKGEQRKRDRLWINKENILSNRTRHKGTS